MVETLARGSGVVEPEILADEERFTVRRADKSATGRDAATPKKGSSLIGNKDVR